MYAKWISCDLSVNELVPSTLILVLRDRYSFYVALSMIDFDATILAFVPKRGVKY